MNNEAFIHGVVDELSKHGGKSMAQRMGAEGGPKYLKPRTVGDVKPEHKTWKMVRTQPEARATHEEKQRQKAKSLSTRPTSEGRPAGRKPINWLDKDAGVGKKKPSKPSKLSALKERLRKGLDHDYR